MKLLHHITQTITPHLLVILLGLFFIVGSAESPLVITMLGNDSVTVTQGTTVQDAGATADHSGNSVRVVASGLIINETGAYDTNLPVGEYKVTYTATYAASKPEDHHMEVAERIVHVVAPTSTSTSFKRGHNFFDRGEEFNRHYMDDQYSSLTTIYVSPNGTGNGETDTTPMPVIDALDQVVAGTEVRFMEGTYNNSCWELDSDQSGTYNEPIVLKADPGVIINCCETGRKACFNLEFANYIAIDGFHLIGGDYGIRAVGGISTSEHQTGIAILNNHGEKQNKDPFFSGASDWIVVDNNKAHDAGEGDGHGIYLSNGGDWMLVSNNELYDNASSDLQINADPISTCEEEGILYTHNDCDGSAREGQGRGISEFIVVENNYLHNSDVGPNFTSVRNSIVRNNIIGFYERHNTSFWQETDNPELGSSHNIIEHNLFIGNNDRHVLQLINNSTNNTIRNNVLLGLSASGDSVNSATLMIEQDDSTQSGNTFEGNYFVGGYFENYTLSGTNQQNNNFILNWFEDFPSSGRGIIKDFKPTLNAPFLDSGQLQTASSPLDIAGHIRLNPVDLGPWHVDADANPVTLSKQYVSYMLDGKALLIEAEGSASAIDITKHLNSNANGTDSWINISPNGEWLLLESTRLHSDCADWACLIYGKRDLSEFSVVQTTSDGVIHPAAFSAISSDGKIIVAQMSIENRFDLFLSRRTGTTWSEPTNITSNLSRNNRSPAISSSGEEVIFNCGDNICIANISNDNISPSILIEPSSIEELTQFGSADFDPLSNDIIFEGEGNSETIWRYNRTNLSSQEISNNFNNDNSPCVLSDGRIASLWLNRPENSDSLHELKVMDSTNINSITHFMATQNTNISDIGLGCGGKR